MSALRRGGRNDLRVRVLGEVPGTIETWHELPLLPHDDGSRHVRRAEGVSSALSLARHEASDATELTRMPLHVEAQCGSHQLR